MGSPVFAIEGLAFAHGDTPVLRGLNMQVEQGTFFGVLGPNGSGKSTLLDLMAGHLSPAAGRVMFRGRPVCALPKLRLARELALAPQDYSLPFAFTVRQTVLMGRHPHIPRFASPAAADLRATAEAMEEMGVTALAHRPVTELSGGEKQRVALARVFAQQASVMLLDEPTSSLDVNHSLAVLHSLERRVREQGRTVVVVMHDINLAAAFCDHLLLLENGRAHSAGPAEAVLTAESLRQVYGVTARVAWDAFAGARVVTLQKPGGAPCAY